MRRRSLLVLGRSTSVAVLSLAFVAAGHAQPATPRDFQSGMRMGIGYSGAIPDAELGISVFHTLGFQHLSVFADAKRTAGSIENKFDYCPRALATCDATWAQANRNDLFVRDIDEWRIFNVGLMRALTRELAVMVGGGAAQRTRFAEFYDDEEPGDEPITPNRSYYVDDSRFSGWTGNLVVAALFRAHRNVAFRVGHETAPGGISLGAYFIVR